MYRSRRSVDLTKLSGKDSQGYHSLSSSSSSESSQERNVTYSRQLGETFLMNDFSWGTPPSITSPLTSHMSKASLNKYYHAFGFPQFDVKKIYESMNDADNKINEKKEIDSSKHKIETPALPNKSQIFDDSILLDTSPPFSLFLSIIAENEKELNDKTVPLGSLDKEYTCFNPGRTSTPLCGNENFENKTFDNFLKLKVPLPSSGSQKRRFSSIDSDQENQPHSKKLRKKVIARRQQKTKQHCSFCKKNGELAVVYNHHTIKDAKGRTLCPVLRQIECPICHKDGDDAHTSEDCPKARLSGSSRRPYSVEAISMIRRQISFLQI